MNETTVLDLKAYVNNIEDPRNNKGKIYTLEQLLICLIYGVACGYDNASDIEDLISKNVKVIIVNPVDSDAVAPAVSG